MGRRRSRSARIDNATPPANCHSSRSCDGTAGSPGRLGDATGLDAGNDTTLRNIGLTSWRVRRQTQRYATHATGTRREGRYRTQPGPKRRPAHTRTQTQCNTTIRDARTTDATATASSTEGGASRSNVRFNLIVVAARLFFRIALDSTALGDADATDGDATGRNKDATGTLRFTTWAPGTLLGTGFGPRALGGQTFAAVRFTLRHSVRCYSTHPFALCSANKGELILRLWRD